MPVAVTPTISFTEGDASGGPVVTVDSSGNLSVLVNNSNTSGGLTSLSSISSAINNYTNSIGQHVFSANVLQAGNVNTAVNTATGVAVDGPATATAANSVTTVTLDGSDAIGLTATGGEANERPRRGSAGRDRGSPVGLQGQRRRRATHHYPLPTGGTGGAGTYTAADLTALFGVNGATSPRPPAARPIPSRRWTSAASPAAVMTPPRSVRAAT